MKSLAEFTERDFLDLARQIQDVSNIYEEEDLFEAIGNGLHDNGLTVAETNDLKIIESKILDEKNQGFDAEKSVKFVLNTAPLTPEKAKQEGKKFWRRFKEKLRSAICTDPKIRELITGNGSLKDYLIAGLPLVLAALGLATLNPLLLGIVAATFALIVKVGFEAYCEN